MKNFVIALMAVMLVTGAVYASDKPALEKPVMPVDFLADLDEVEPNDDCGSADVIAAGDTYSAAIDPAGDEDWFEVFVVADGAFTFETHPGDAGDTKMYIYAADCTTELAFNDDGGEGFYSKIEGFEVVTGETVYVQIIHYSTSGTGTYLLTMTEDDPPCPTPDNNTCDGALELPMCQTFTVDNCGATNDYDPESGGCTGWAAAGLDLVYMVELVENQQLTITGVTTYDNSIYLITDCADPVGSCVAGADATTNGTETLVFDTADAPGTYYLILDGFSSTGHEGIWDVTVDCVVATEATTFDGLKSMYR